MRIGIVSTWNATCGVSEFASFLVAEFKKLGHDVAIAANRFAGECRAVPGREDGTEVLRGFDTGHAPESSRRFDLERIAEFLNSQELDVVYLNYQDFLYPDKAAVNALIKSLKAHRRDLLVFALTHDTCISPQIAWGEFTAVITATDTLKAHFGRLAQQIQQGIPTFELDNPGLLRVKYEVDPKARIISVFGLGRNDLEGIDSVIRYIAKNAEPEVRYVLQVFAPTPEQVARARQLIVDDDSKREVRIVPGYISAEALAEQLHMSSAVIIRYPQITHHATSSALRFAIGSLVPVIANASNWNADLQQFGAWIALRDDSLDKLKNELVSLFQNYEFNRDRLTRISKTLIGEIGWPTIARQHLELITRLSPLRRS